MKKLACTILAFAFSLNASAAWPHAVAGDRVFPATLTVDDPGVSDELTLPQVSRFKAPSDSGTNAWATDISAEFDKRITDKFGISLASAWVTQQGVSGFDNLGVGAKYVFLTQAKHEFMLSAGLDWDMGNTGAKRIGENFSTVTPALFFGKGFGDLPDSVEWLKPFALTGTLGYSLPTRSFSPDDNGDKARNPQSVNWGFTLQYSLPYLQQHVRDLDLAAPFGNAIPVIEFSMQTPTGGDQSGRTTGTINPGVIFMGRDMQLGVEALLPVNRESGSNVGFMVQTHFYLDDMFPTSIGKPIW